MLCTIYLILLSCFFFNDTATTEIYTLSLHDALPISSSWTRSGCPPLSISADSSGRGDRKSTRLNSSHGSISYAVFGLKQKKHRAMDDRSALPSPAASCTRTPPPRR